jgi:hypothetical protein
MTDDNTTNGSITEVERLLHRYAIRRAQETQMAAHNNIREFLNVTLANGPISVRDLETKARTAGLLRPDQSASQTKLFRRTADKLGVKRLQKERQWHWALPTPAVADQKELASDAGSVAIETPESAVAAPEMPSSGASPSSDDRDGGPMTKEEFIRASIVNCRALAREAYAEANVMVARYLETGDLADLFPERNSPVVGTN